jgi:tetratricopeptide (TPR) repeat protein
MKRFLLLAIAVSFVFTGLQAQVFTGTAKKENVVFADRQAIMQYNKGIEYYGLKNYDSAVVAFTRALEYDPAYYNALYNRAVIYYETGEYAKSIRDLELIKGQRSDSRFFNLMGKNQEALNQSSKALISFRAATELAPETAVNFYHIGAIYLKQSKYQDAIGYFSTAIEKDATAALFFNDRGIAYRESGDIEKALQDFQKATMLNSNLDYAFNNLGDIRMKMEQYKEAETEFTAALKINPDNYIAFNNRGLARLKLGETDYAYQDFLKAHELKPEFYEALNNMGYVLYLNQEYQEAMKFFTDLIKSHPDIGMYYYNRAIVKEMMRDEVGACDDWSQALELGVKEAAEYLENCK